MLWLCVGISAFVNGLALWRLLLRFSSCFRTRRSRMLVLVKSSPAQGATVTAGGVVNVTLTYNSRIDVAHSSLHLVGPDGKSQSLAVDAHAAPNLLVAKAPVLTAGAYKLEWQVMATDGHITRGIVEFRVA